MSKEIERIVQEEKNRYVGTMPTVFGEETNRHCPKCKSRLVRIYRLAEAFPEDDADPCIVFTVFDKCPKCNSTEIKHVEVNPPVEYSLETLKRYLKNKRLKE